MTSCAQRFQLDELPALSRTAIDRNDLLRDQAERLVELWPTAKVLPLDKHGRAPMARGQDGLRLDLRPTESYGSAPPVGSVLLGAQDGTCYWGLRAEPDGPVQEGFGWEATIPEGDGIIWQDLRMAGGVLSDVDAGLLTTAVAVLSWHGHSGFCARCGSATEPKRAGWARHCTGCGHEEYPRTDPAVICLVHDGADQVLLARQPTWPADRYSVLAGFVEGGESLEACVAREVEEEVGVRVRDIHYLGSQPWPFPRSLMVGFAAVADPSVPLVPADGEIESAFWVGRDKLREALAAGGSAPGLILPGITSIARRMLESWASS
ncbi:NAD(+) diphosphatase [Kutzneria viridogrisea]|uniref:NAD(+) diphosphatase n=1 Tax=Kutzneria viridogrisea TaxID=47990 RepID=A0ABR6BU38_9PSEU|nr:NAD+ diphosphatase [Kutzneria viridogrisea]